MSSNDNKKQYYEGHIPKGAEAVRGVPPLVLSCKPHRPHNTTDTIQFTSMNPVRDAASKSVSRPESAHVKDRITETDKATNQQFNRDGSVKR